jgi:Rrf2 family protein
VVLSRTSRYALRAVAYIAANQGDDTRIAIDRISEALDVPRNYLSKVLNTLAHEEVLDSSRGRGGGFRLAVPAEQLTLQRVIAPFEDDRGAIGCLLHERRCDPERPCLAHDRWKDASAAMREFFGHTTVQEVVAGRLSL